MLNEPDKIFVVNLSAPVNASVVRDQGVGTILNDDGLPALNVSDVQVKEGDSGTTDAVFQVNLSSPAARRSRSITRRSMAPPSRPPITPATAGTLTFAPGETQHSVTVKVNGDSHL